MQPWRCLGGAWQPQPACSGEQPLPPSQHQGPTFPRGAACRCPCAHTQPPLMRSLPPCAARRAVQALCVQCVPVDERGSGGVLFLPGRQRPEAGLRPAAGAVRGVGGVRGARGVHGAPRWAALCCAVLRRGWVAGRGRVCCLGLEGEWGVACWAGSMWGRAGLVGGVPVMKHTSPVFVSSTPKHPTLQSRPGPAGSAADAPQLRVCAGRVVRGGVVGHAARGVRRHPGLPGSAAGGGPHAGGLPHIRQVRVCMCVRVCGGSLASTVARRACGLTCLLACTRIKQAFSSHQPTQDPLPGARSTLHNQIPSTPKPTTTDLLLPPLIQHAALLQPQGLAGAAPDDGGGGGGGALCAAARRPPGQPQGEQVRGGGWREGGWVGGGP